MIINWLKIVHIFQYFRVGYVSKVKLTLIMVNTRGDFLMVASLREITSLHYNRGWA